MSNLNAQRSLAYDNATYVTRQSAQLTANSAGSGSTSGKFVAWTAMTVYGVTFSTTTAGTSTYTVAGTSTTAATQMSALYVTNTSTSTVVLATTTVGPFTIGGTGTTGTNVSVGGIGGVAGGYQGPYSINTLGGTTTSQTWGTNTFVLGTATVSQTSVAPAGGGNFNYGGFPMNPGDSISFVMGTDATAVLVPIVQYSVQSPLGQVLT